MRRVPAYALAIAAGAAFTTANAQFTSAKPVPSKATVTAAIGGTGGFLGSDNCASPHTPAGSGDVFGVPFTNGTTGTQGQNEAGCYFFGTTAIDADVWYDWSSTAAGQATVTTCTGTSVDTKIAVWPGTAGCPADGTSLACNDDACGLQSSTTWPIAAATTYTIQVGTFPGAAPGSGTFDITQGTPPPCGTYDDGTTENALGLTAGGETGWLHNQECLQTVDRVETAYGTTLGTAPPNGNASCIFVFEDSDCDRNPTTPAAGMTVVWSVATVVTNAATDILNNIPAPTPGINIASRCTFVMATSNQAAGEFPAPMDQTNPTPKAWIVGNTPAPDSMDKVNLNNNNVPPLQTDAIGFPTAWLLRANGMESSGDPFPPACFGDGGGATCGCGNNGGAGEGCSNSTGSGAVIAGQGNPSFSGDTFEIITTQIPNSPGLTFQGNILLANPSTFGDGIRCCGQGVVRWITVAAQGNCASTMQPSGCGLQVGGIGGPITQHPGNGGLQPGDSRCYQHWYRDPGMNNPCGADFFNLSPAIVATFGA